MYADRDRRPLLSVGVQIMDESMLEWFLHIPIRDLVREVFGHYLDEKGEVLAEFR